MRSATLIKKDLGKTYERETSSIWGGGEDWWGKHKLKTQNKYPTYTDNGRHRARTPRNSLEHIVSDISLIFPQAHFYLILPRLPFHLMFLHPHFHLLPYLLSWEEVLVDHE